MTRGDSETFSVRMVDSSGSDLTFKEGSKITFTVRKSIYGPKLICKEITEITEDGKVFIEIKPEDTSCLDFCSYVYDVELRYPSGNVSTIIKPSMFTLGPEVSY